MAEVHLPPTLPRVFADLPRCVEVDAATVGEAIDRLEERWPGLRDRLCEPAAEGVALRPHVKAFVGGERAATLDTPLDGDARVDLVAAISGGA